MFSFFSRYAKAFICVVFKSSMIQIETLPMLGDDENKKGYF